MAPVSSTLTLPPAKELRAFRLSMVGSDTVRTYLINDYSLAICCRGCRRLIEWTPPDLLRRFGDRLDVRIADIALRLTCAGEGGCGSHDIAVFPHLYDDADWHWLPQETSH